jgi:hypothetical protein
MRLLHHLLVRGQPTGFGRRCRVVGVVLDVFHRVDLSTICVMIASRLVSLRRRQSIVMT